ncbi:hypothetical protein ACLMNJ_32685 [Streptomyces seoulensis]
MHTPAVRPALDHTNLLAFDLINAFHAFVAASGRVVPACGTGSWTRTNA